MPREKRYADNAARLKAWRETKRNVSLNETIRLETETIRPENETIPETIPSNETIQQPTNETKRNVSDRSIALSDGQVYHPVLPKLEGLEPSKAYPRQPNRCIRCGSRIPSSDNFCGDLHYKEHLRWLEGRSALSETGQEGQEGPSDGAGGMITPPISSHVEDLKSQLEDLKAQYTVAQGRQDWAECSQVNVEREPLFKELFKLTNGQGYFFPARFYSKN